MWLKWSSFFFFTESQRTLCKENNEPYAFSRGFFIKSIIDLMPSDVRFCFTACQILPQYTWHDNSMLQYSMWQPFFLALFCLIIHSKCIFFAVNLLSFWLLDWKKGSWGIGQRDNSMLLFISSQRNRLTIPWPHTVLLLHRTQTTNWVIKVLVHF